MFYDKVNVNIDIVKDSGNEIDIKILRFFVLNNGDKDIIS